MNANIKKYFWPVAAGLATYVLLAWELNRELHCLANKDFVTMFFFPLGIAALVSTAINLKFMKPTAKKYCGRMIIGMVAYILGLDIANHLPALPTPYNYLLILLPVLPLIYISYLFIRQIAELDEMKRKIYMEALAFSAVATGFSCFSYLFLRDAGAPEFRAEWAFYMMWGYYGIGLIFSWRRYQ
jgi:hypothetical protein